MNKVLTPLLVCLIVFGSCKKNSDNNYHVSYTEDGTNKSYTGHVFAHIDTSGGYTALTLVGAVSSSSFDDYMGLYIDNFPGHGNIVAGEYTDASTAFTLLGTYAKPTAEYEAGQSVAQDAASGGVTIANHFKVNIISIDGNTIRGTFSGDFYKDGDPHSTKLSITNGDFNAKFIE